MNGLALCSGIGGLEFGLHLALPEYRTVAYVEREAFCAAVLVATMEAGALAPAPIWDDVATFDGRAWSGRVHLVSAGVPCQPWSCAGKRKGVEDERWIWPDIWQIIREVGPSIVLLEEVPGFVRGGLARVLSDLAEGGFHAEWDLFSAADVGASHLRRRLFILAHANRVEHKGRPSESGDDGSELAPVTGGGRLWPPGPYEDWAGIPRAFWAALPKPELRRMVDGISVWSHQLQALGNSVVPLVAAVAFRTLSARIGMNGI